MELSKYRQQRIFPEIRKKERGEDYLSQRTVMTTMTVSTKVSFAMIAKVTANTLAELTDASDENYRKATTTIQTEINTQT